MPRRWCASVSLAAMVGSVVACGDDLPDALGSSTSTGLLGTSMGSSTAIDTTGPSGPPQIVDIGQDLLVLREGESVVLTAVVVDPDDDVAGGELLGPGEPARYGTFTAHPSSRWRASLGWSEIRERMPLTFEQQLELPFTVRFWDAQGHETTGSTTIRAVCGGILDTACDGECVDVQVDDDHCDGCGQSCVVGPDLEGAPPSGGCDGGTCRPWWSGCFRLDPRAPPQTCAQHCAAQGARCAPQGCYGAFDPKIVMAYSEPGICEQDIAVLPARHACDASLVALGEAEALRCCCA